MGGMKANPRPKILDEADGLIKSGQIAETRERLQIISIAQIERRDRQDFAKICRRVGLIHLGLRCLKPLIHPEGLLTEPATPFEKAEYAVLLSRVGAIREALGLLSGREMSSVPDAALYEGFAHVSDWNYEKAKVAFQTYLSKSYDPYTTLIARVNLAACLVYGEDPAAESFLDETLSSARDLKALRLQANCHELRGHARLQASDVASAEEDFRAAAEIFGELKIVDQLLVHKGLALIDSKSRQSITPLLEFRSLCETRGSWENCREIDYLLLRETFSTEGFLRLYFGTPYIGFRERMVRHFKLPVPDSALIGRGECVLDLTSASAPPKILRLLTALSRDAYSPTKLGRLFSEVYPDEFFDIHSSPLRIRQQLTRARQWLQKNAPQVSIHFEGGGSRLHFDNERSIRVPHFQTTEPQYEHFAHLQKSFLSQSFSAQEACEVLAVSRMSFLRWTAWAVDQHILTISGQGRATRYQLIALPHLLTRLTTVA